MTDSSPPEIQAIMKSTANIMKTNPCSSEPGNLHWQIVEAANRNSKRERSVQEPAEGQCCDPASATTAVNS